MEYEYNSTLQAQAIYNNTDEIIFANNYTDSEQWYINASKTLRNVCVPIISSIGFFGNTLSIIVFCMRRMRKSSSSVFLAALAMADNIFLLGEVITWVDGEWVVLLSHEISCKCVIFVTHVSSFLSAWFIVGFTCERFFAICFPLQNQVRSVYRERLATLGLTVLACVIYHYNFWTVTVKQYATRPKCSIKYDYINFLQAVTWLDSVITMIIPFVTIAVMNTMVFRKAFASLTNPMKQSNVTGPAEMIVQQSNESRRAEVTLRVKRKDPRIRLTRTLLLVSSTFLIMNLPSHIMRLYNLVMSSISGEHMISIKLYFFHEVTMMLYYTTFSCNFAIYTLSENKFRNSLRSMCSCCLTVGRRRWNSLNRMKTKVTHNGYSTSYFSAQPSQTLSSTDSVFSDRLVEFPPLGPLE